MYLHSFFFFPFLRISYSNHPRTICLKAFLSYQFPLHICKKRNHYLYMRPFFDYYVTLIYLFILMQVSYCLTCCIYTISFEIIQFQTSKSKVIQSFSFKVNLTVPDDPLHFYMNVRIILSVSIKMSAEIEFYRIHRYSSGHLTSKRYLVP